MSRASDDLALLEGAFRGDEAMRTELVLRLLPTVEARVRATALRRRREHEVDQVAADMTQQLFLSLFENGARKLRAWNPARAASLPSFVGLIAEREVLSSLRRARRNPFKETATETGALELHLGPNDRVEHLLMQRDFVDRVLDRALESLGTSGGSLIFQRLWPWEEEDVAVVAAEDGDDSAL